MPKLTGEEMDAMDREVFERLFEARVNMDTRTRKWMLPLESPFYRDYDCEILSHVPKFTRDIAAAWEVVEKMQETHSLRIDTYHDQANVFVKFYQGQADDTGTEWADTAPLAICYAALAALRAVKERT